MQRWVRLAGCFSYGGARVGLGREKKVVPSGDRDGVPAVCTGGKGAKVQNQVEMPVGSPPRGLPKKKKKKPLQGVK